MRQLYWPLDSFAAVPGLPASETDVRARALRTRYPIRYLRYWFVHSLLDEERRRLGRPLRVLEVGVDRGQMLSFMGGRSGADGRPALPQCLECWDGLDVQADADDLERHGYTGFLQADIEQPLDLGARRYDAIVLLHVLEHLRDPEAAVMRLSAALRVGGLMVGGSPTMPDWLGRLHERSLRRKYADRMHDVRLHKHLSVITPGRLRRLARTLGFSPELIAGTFFMRASGSPLENLPVWIRANLLWGGLFPALGGELCFSLRKPDAAAG